MDTITKVGGLLKFTSVVSFILGPVFYIMFLNDWASKILRGERNATDSDSAGQDRTNWFHVKLLRELGNLSTPKQLISKVVNKIRERMSYLEMFFLYDRVQTLE